LWTNATLALGAGEHNLIYYANDSSGNLGFNSTTFIVNYIYENVSFTTPEIELETTTILLNLTANTFTTFNGTLFYNGTAQPTSYTNTSTVMMFNSSFVPSDMANNSFYVQYYLDDVLYNTTTYYQVVNLINFSHCDAGNPFPYLNISFKDESTDTAMTAYVDSSTWVYYTSTASKNKTYRYSSPTSFFTNYSFCFTPNDTTVITSATFKYSNTSYPQRTYTISGSSYTNTTTETTLYLLGSANGIYSSINVIESSGAVISGVNVIIERQIGGIWVPVGQATTGSDGTVTFWVNPNYQHRITATKLNYVTNQATITPSQSLYTMTMSTSSGTGSYNSSIPGIKYTMRPGGGSIGNGTLTNFNVTVTSTKSNLENCKFDLLNNTNLSDVLATSTSFTNSTYCMPSLDYTLYKGQTVFGRLYLDTDKTDGFVIVHSDWKWIAIDKDSIKVWRGITGIFGDFKEMSDFGEGVEGEFSKFVIFFIIMTILIGAFFYFSGAEANSPGISLFIVFMVILIGTIGGFLTFDSGSDNVDSSIEKFGFLILFILYAGGYFMNLFGRENQ